MIELTKVVHDTYNKLSINRELVVAVSEYTPRVSTNTGIQDIFKHVKCTLEVRLPQSHTPYGSTISVVLPTRIIHVSETYREVLNMMQKKEQHENN